MTVDHVDIALEDVAEHKYKESEDPKLFKSKKTGRGPLGPGWKESQLHPGKKTVQTTTTTTDNI